MARINQIQITLKHLQNGKLFRRNAKGYILP
jgi:hypothetical protein